MRAGGGAPLPLRIAAILLPADAREEVLGDLLEKWVGDVRQRAWLSRLLWAWQQPWIALSARVRYGRRDVARGARFTQVRPGFSLLDWKLGFRMLVKFPVLSLVGGVSLATAIGLGAGAYHLGKQILWPSLGLEEGERIVRLQHYDVVSRTRGQIHLEEFVAWREKLTQVGELSALTTSQRTLIDRGSTDGAVRSATVRVATVTASTFLLTRVRPLRGRVLMEGDERAGAPDVMILGYELWQKQLGGDPNIVGRELQLGPDRVTVVGIMPPGFAFPSSQNVWTPLRFGEIDLSAVVSVVGRLAPGASLASARTEFSAIGAQARAELARRSGELTTASTGDSLVSLVRPQVLNFLTGPDIALGDYLGVAFGGFLFLLGMAAVCTSVATLIFARTAMRQSEIVIRNALGASRGRIVGQLFVEALVLVLIAAGVGLGVAQWAVKYWMSGAVDPSTETLPFWRRDSFDLGTVLVTAGLALFGATLVALLPAMKATGKGVSESLKSTSAGAMNLRFGGVWSVIIVFQVAMTVLGLPFAVGLALDSWRAHLAGTSFPGEHYLTFGLAVEESSEGAPKTPESRRLEVAIAYEALSRGLEGEPGVEAVTFGTGIPGMVGSYADLELESSASDSAQALRTWARPVSVDVRYFDVMGFPILVGRDFTTADLGATSRPVVINESFARELGENPLGVRVRAPPTNANRIRGNSPQDEPGPWFEVVGIVRNMGTVATRRDVRGGADVEDRMIFSVAAPSVSPLHVYVRTADQAALLPRLRAIAAQIDPEILLVDPMPLDVAMEQSHRLELTLALAGGGAVFLCVLLCCASLFALMAVAVSGRTREMGIRIAIGASRVTILSALFGRALLQLCVGTVVGSVLFVGMGAIVVTDGGPGLPGLAHYVSGPLLTVALIMVLVGLAACAVPARRALRIEPVEALRD